MNLDNLKEYFDKYIIEYAPYEDKLIYTQISNFLLNYYFTHSYSTIPNIFKASFENQQIPIELYDTLLLSNGFPKDLIDNISFVDKYTLLYSFMDYNRYKGSIEIMKKVCNSFTQTFNLYELFIDYNETIGKWVFIPFPIYVNNTINEYKLEKYFLFNTINNATKHFFITEEYLDSLKEDKSIIFPIKTNLLFTDYKDIYNYNELNKLIFAITFRHFKNYQLVVYFQPGGYQTSFENIYKLWYYIFLKVYPATFEYMANENPNILPLVFDIQAVDFPFTLSDIDKIEKDYKEINTPPSNIKYQFTNGKYSKKEGSSAQSRKRLSEFYKNYLLPFREFLASEEIDTNILLEKYRSILPNNLISYIDEKLDPALPKNELEFNANSFLKSIRNSLMTWSYSFTNDNILKYNRYLLTFLDHLPIIKINFDKTTPYYLINFLKPYHAELIINEDFLVSVKNKFNTIYIDDVFNFKNTHQLVSVDLISDESKSQTNFTDNDGFPLLNTYQYNVNHKVNEYLNIQNQLSSLISEIYNTVLLASSYEYFSIINNKKDYLLSADRYQHNISFQKDLDVNISYSVTINPISSFAQIIPLAHFNQLETSYIFNFQISILENLICQYIYPNRIFINFQDKGIIEINHFNTALFNISNFYKFYSSKRFNDLALGLERVNYQVTYGKNISFPIIQHQNRQIPYHFNHSIATISNFYEVKPESFRRFDSLFARGLFNLIYIPPTN